MSEMTEQERLTYAMHFKSPMYNPEYNLEVAIGGIKFRDDVIKNLRAQIINLRIGLNAAGVGQPAINELQYSHLIKTIGES